MNRHPRRALEGASELAGAAVAQEVEAYGRSVAREGEDLTFLSELAGPKARLKVQANWPGLELRAR